MNQQPVQVGRVSWQDLCPWMIIFKSLPIAASVTVLSLALVGVVMVPMGWMVSESIFITEELRQDAPRLDEITEINRSPYRGLFKASDEQSNQITVLGARLSGPRLVFKQTVEPFYKIFDGSCSAREFWYYMLGSFWSIIVWSYIGVAIVRVCLLRLTRDERAGMDDAFEYANGKSITAMFAVCMPLLAVLALCVPMFVIGLCMGFDLGTLIAGIFWIVVLALSGVMAILLLGLLFGWPLIISSVAAEGQNSFDAMTRAYAYTFQRPVHYVFYMFIATLFGGFCWIVVAQLADGVVNLSYWSTGWGANRTAINRIEFIRNELDETQTPETIDENDTNLDAAVKSFAPVQDDSKNTAAPPTNPGTAEPASKEVKPAKQDPITAAVEGTSTPSSTLKIGRLCIRFWTGFAKTMAVAFLYGLFWCMAGSVYLLLRYEIDETEMDEIYIVDERRTYELPPLKSDESGIPQIQPLSESPPPESGSG